MEKLSPYHSLLDNITPEEYLESQSYRGNLASVLEELLRPNIPVLKIISHPPRIVRAMIDYKINHPEDAQMENLLQEAIKTSLAIYQDDGQILLSALSSKVNNCQNLIDQPIVQHAEQTVLFTFNPRHYQELAQDIARELAGKPILLVALAHGGIPTGMDLFLRYQSLSTNPCSLFYVARYSTRKAGDIRPQLSAREILYLQEQGIGKQPIIYDEVNASGKTLRGAYGFFSQKVFPNDAVWTLTGFNAKHK